MWDVGYAEDTAGAALEQSGATRGWVMPGEEERLMNFSATFPSTRTSHKLGEANGAQ